MNELRNNQELTTADIANPQRGREYRSAVIDEHPIPTESAVPVTQNTDERAISSPSQDAPVAQKKEEMADGPLFREDELQRFRSRWDRARGELCSPERPVRAAALACGECAGSNPPAGGYRESRLGCGIPRSASTERFWWDRISAWRLSSPEFRRELNLRAIPAAAADRGFCGRCTALAEDDRAGDAPAARH